MEIHQGTIVRADLRVRPQRTATAYRPQQILLNMKKIPLLTPLLLSLAFHACNPLNLIDPIPDPVEGWVYVLQTKKDNSNGALLCTMAPGHSGQPQMGWSDVDFVRLFGLTSAIVTIPAIEGATATVWVETTLPYWTINIGKKLENVEIVPKVESFSFPILGGMHNLSILTSYRTTTLMWAYSVGGTDTALFSLCADELNHVPTGITLPNFSGAITINRLHSDFNGIFICYIKVPGMYGHPPVYTGFRVRFD